MDKKTTSIPSVSRQQRWQVRKKAKGKCIICGKPRVNSSHCASCREKQRIYGRNYKRKLAGIPLDAPLWSRIRKT